jgi:hypothetical protein
MSRAHAVFKRNIAEAKQLSALHEFLNRNMNLPMSHDDILRAQLVNCVSAFDKLIHDLILDGVLEIYLGRKAPTSKYLNEALPLSTYIRMQSATIPPPEYFFKEAMFTKLKTVSYQDPSKIADGLSYIWDESHKWVKIANEMGTTDDALKRDLRLIATRRNSIVHEADLDPVTHLKLDVDAPTIITNSNFLEACGDAIENLVS